MKPKILSCAALALLAAGLNAPVLAASPNAGRDMAANCANCHGTDGKSLAGMPVLAGQPKEYLIQQMKDFKAGKRPATIMHQIAKGYSDEQIELMAEFFAAQKTAAPAPAPQRSGY